MPEQSSCEDTFAGLKREPRKVRWVWLVYALIYALAIPWYWPAHYRGPLIGGFPLWVGVTLVSTMCLALWTAWVVFRYWQGDEGGEE